MELALEEVAGVEHSSPGILLRVSHIGGLEISHQEERLVILADAQQWNGICIELKDRGE